MVAASLVPATALLVPGAAGRAEVLVDLRARALDAVAALLAARPEDVVVVAPGPADREVDGPVRASLGSAGVPDARLSWSIRAEHPASLSAQVGAPVVGVAASVGLLLLARSGWVGPVRVVEVGPPGTAPAAGATTDRGADLRGLGSRLAGTGAAAGGSRVGLLVVGSLSARHGPDAPLADDERAPAYDAAVVADLADGGPAARDRLRSLDEGVAGELAVSGWGPWQVLLGAVGDHAVEAVVLAASAPFGAQHVAATWLPVPVRAGERS
ncbi:class III extradiol dioxygenase subunit B-like domain-containing protein [soil metagenome]